MPPLQLLDHRDGIFVRNNGKRKKYLLLEIHTLDESKNYIMEIHRFLAENEQLSECEFPDNMDTKILYWRACAVARSLYAKH